MYEEDLMYAVRITIGMGILATMLGCGTAPPPLPELVLPAGDAELGKAAFLEMRRYDCHTLPGVDLPVAEEPNQAVVELGGKVSKVRSYSDLVTSIINPSHKLARGYNEQLVASGGKSNMTNYNEAMTVAELINLVAYLEERYGVEPE